MNYDQMMLGNLFVSRMEQIEGDIITLDQIGEKKSPSNCQPGPSRDTGPSLSELPPVHS